MSQVPESKSIPVRVRRSRHGPALSVERILAEAMVLVDAEGQAGFSFRGLAGRLGCQAMSLYHYFPSKAHLYEALVDQMLAEIGPVPLAGDWREGLRAVASSYRAMALRHPGMFLYFSGFRLNNRAGLDFLEGVLGLFERAGLVAEARARHFRILGHYLVGACLDEVAKGPSSTCPVPFDVARLAYPGLMAVGPYFLGDRQKAVFDAGIDLLIKGVEADLTL